MPVDVGKISRDIERHRGGATAHPWIRGGEKEHVKPAGGEGSPGVGSGPQAPGPGPPPSRRSYGVDYGD